MNNQISGSSKKKSRFPGLWRDLLLFSCGGLLVVAIAALIVWNPLDVKALTNPDAKEYTSNLAAPQAPTDYQSSQNLRKYYLTDTTWDAWEIVHYDECIEGFHMASAWELMDPSNLQYDRNGAHLVFADSGHGPPTFISGWVRTGFDSNISETAGMANCANWTTSGSGERGTNISLTARWYEAADLLYWEADDSLCTEQHHVWCIQDAIDVTPPMRQYYLTKDSSFDGSEPDGSDGYGAGVCAFGYHFASMWELIDPSNLQYNVNQGWTRSDSGMGPPSGTQGWMRTGSPSADDGLIGQMNCFSWDSAGSGEFGAVVSLPTNWEDPDQVDNNIWSTASAECVSSQRVWCVANEVNSAGSCALPERISCGQTVSGSTYGLPSHLDNYECTLWDESGPEKVYALTLQEGYTYDVTASITIEGSADLDIFFLTRDGCSTGGTMNEGACGNNSVSQYDLDPGTYYIVVDGFNGVWGDYDLNVTCSPTFVYMPDVQK